MNLYVAVNNKERHYVTAKNYAVAIKLIKRRLLKKFGYYNITDFRFVCKVHNTVQNNNANSTMNYK